MTDSELRGLWRKAGGNFHGPSVETGTMPEANLLPFLRELMTAEGKRYAPLMQAVEWLLDDGHMNQEHLARLRAAWEAV